MARVMVAILLALGAMVGAVAWLGSRLPVGHVASRSVVIGAPIDVVFQTITDFAASVSWRSGLKSVTVDDRLQRPAANASPKSPRLEA